MGNISIINFMEIPEAHIATGNQDLFELFARDFFTDILKLKTLSEPCRGADGGKDILFEEYQSGTLSENRIIWLVSCKHKAHSGNSINPDDESNITDRLAQFNANGFIGFYSTLTSSSLNTRLDNYKNKYKIEIFDRQKIEKYILQHKSYELFKRYFPKSYKNWCNMDGKYEPTKILTEYEPLRCCVCGIDLLKVDRSDNQNHGILGFVMQPETYKYIDIYTACLGKCDRIMQARFLKKGFYTAWDSLSDILIPTIYLKRLMAILNQLHKGELEFDTYAFDKYKNILLAVSQYVFRHQSENDLERVEKLSDLPDGF